MKPISVSTVIILLFAALAALAQEQQGLFTPGFTSIFLGNQLR
jgi:hypothetical protein